MYWIPFILISTVTVVVMRVVAKTAVREKRKAEAKEAATRG